VRIVENLGIRRLPRKPGINTHKVVNAFPPFELEEETMRSWKDLVGIVVPYLICFGLWCVYGCHIILPLDEPECNRMDCRVDIYRCASSNLDAQASISNPVPHGTCYQWMPPSTPTNKEPGLRIDQRIYCDPDANWRVKKIQLPQLKGCAYVRSQFKDNMNNTSEFLRFPRNPNIQKIFVAYDDRFTDKPYWLTADYKQRLGLNLEELYITIAKPDQPQFEVDLEIWEMKDLPKVGDPVIIPGNLFQNPKWPAGFPVSNAAMYLVIVMPDQQFDCSQQTPNLFVGTDILDPCSAKECYDEPGKAETLAIEECEKAFIKDTHVCVNPTCTVQQKCPPEEASTEYSLTLGPRRYMRSSEIEFKNTPSFQSQAEITMFGDTYTTEVDGILHFEYELDDQGRMHTIQINGMLLNLSDVSTSEGTFKNMVVALLDPVIAQCTDAIPPWATPCTTYEIQSKTFTASTAANRGDELFFLVARNEYRHSITIDHQNRVFQLKGPISTSIEVNNEESPINIDIDVTGRFLNFAPRANGNESTRFVECAERSNKAPVYLDAGQSFDIDGMYGSSPLPNAIASYAWYEDFGTAVEKSWGSGKQVAIGTYQLAWGVHDITLEVRDMDGIADRHTFQVEVQDTQPPELIPPQDIYIYWLSSNPPPQHINIGQASCSDMCSDDVVVTNDAPAGSTFEPGFHVVTWKADDGTGNVATDVQKILFFELKPPSLWELPFRIADTIRSNRWRIQQCLETSMCNVNLASLVNIVAQAAEQIQGVWDSEAALLAQVQEAMQTARQFVINADALVIQSNEQTEGRQDLRDSAAASMNFYVQTYTSGAILIIVSPDGATVYAFFDDDYRNGLDADDLGGMGAHLNAQFTEELQGIASMSMGEPAPTQYQLHRWFAASSSESYQGIFKNTPLGQTASMNVYVQTYDSSIIAISSTDARTFKVFLDPNKTDGLDAEAMAGSGRFTCDFSTEEAPVGTWTYAETEPVTFTLYQHFLSLVWTSPEPEMGIRRNGS